MVGRRKVPPHPVVTFDYVECDGLRTGVTGLRNDACRLVTNADNCISNASLKSTLVGKQGNDWTIHFRALHSSVTAILTFA